MPHVPGTPGKKTMFEQLADQTQVSDEVTFLQQFRYETYFDPNSQVFTVAIVMAKSGKRYHLPFDRLNFGVFVRDLNSSLDAVQSRESEISGNGSSG